MSSKSRKKASRRGSAGPIAFFVAVFIVALGSIQLASTFHTYALNMAELNGLKKQEAALIAQKQELENDIARWDDKAYVTAQARDRLGFVFPGEQAIRVEHPEAVTGETTEDAKKTDESQKTVLPWYKEMAYSFKQADQSDEVKSKSRETSESTSTGESDANGTIRWPAADFTRQQPTAIRRSAGVTQGMTISEQAKALAKKVLDQPATEHDIAVVERQLGRYPRGMVAVGARCVCGRPLAVVTRPLLPGGVPFPTTCYLTGPEAVKAISHIEAEGKMKEYNDLLAEDDDLKAAYERAHELYLAFRHEIAVAMEDSEEHIEGTSAGGMPVRIKCLHALLAQTLVMGEGANPIGDMALEAIRHEFDPNVCRCTVENED